jgi:hypothetical protein
MGVGTHDAVDDRHQTAGDEQRTERVEVSPDDGPTPLGDDRRREQQHGESNGHVDQEDRRPAETLREQPAEQHPGRGADAADGPPDAQRAVALATLGERGGDDRQAGR